LRDAPVYANISNMNNTRIRYSIDPTNRLLLPQFRYILDGEFKTDKKNTLTYIVRSPRPPSIPHQLKLSGNWSLDKNHNLVMTLNKENNQLAGQKITLQSEIIRAKADKLEFLISAKDKSGLAHLYILGLSGTWQADKYNRLKFLVQKKNDAHNELMLSGSWEIDKNNQIIYTYTKTGLKTGRKIRQNIAFKGHWDFSKKYRLIYVLNKGTGSGFDFTVSLGRPLGRGLQYEAGVGLKPSKKIITLFGSWKMNEKLGLLFEMPSEEGHINAVRFGANLQLNKNQELELSLKNNLQKDLGIKLKLSKILTENQGEAFLQAAREGRKITFQAGAGFRW